jgi:hypothetical protein
MAVYLAVGAVMAILAVAFSRSIIAGAAALLMSAAVVGAIWLSYKAILWVFEREARQSVDFTDEGVREIHDGREYAFIPWDGVKEIELDGTFVAGAGIRVKGNFSEIAVSNADLVITGPMGIREMHRAFGQTKQLVDLLNQVRAIAPGAEVKLNRLARRRMESE